MSGILVVERSTTLSHLVQRTLRVAQLASQGELSSYIEALDHLRRATEMGQPYQLLILGAPQRSTADFEALLVYLADGGGERLPVLLMGHERTPALAAWCEARPQTQLKLWADFGRIPVAIQQLAPTPSVAAPGSPETAPLPVTRSAGLLVLFVDDSASVRLAYQHLLEHQGYRVEVAANLGEATAKVRATPYDLVICDYFLPDGNGDELCRRLTQTHGNSALVAVITGTYREDIIKRCLEAGAVECMFKNEAKELFLTRVNSLARQIEMRKSAESERLRLDGILGSVGDGVYGVDQVGRITFVNPTGLRLLGYAEESELVGRSAHDAIHHSGSGGDRLSLEDSPLSRGYAKDTALSRFETVLWDKAGQALAVECSVLPLNVQGRIEGSVVVFRDISERKSADVVRWELTHDSLTGLSNARHFAQQAAGELNRRREQGGYSALLYIDIDRFTYVVDTGGQQAGERLLMDIAHLVGKRLRENDVLARIEGDRLGLLLSGVQLDNLFSIADSYRELLHQCQYEANGQKRYATASIGVAVIGKDTPSAEYALEHARLACKNVKHRGRDQTEIYIGEHDVRIAREIESGWTERFRAALQNDSFQILLQPIVPLAALPTTEQAIVERQGWRVNGAGGEGHEYLFELLIRMVGEEGRSLAPSVFVPLAERVGIMPKIDLWVLQRLLRFLTTLKKTPAQLAFNINLSNMTLADPESLSMIESAVRGSGVEPRQLVFEITETSEMTSMHVARRFMSTLKALGCRFALDDFGTGFSSFTHLRHLPVDFVKVEGSFVEGMPGSDLDRKMVASITQLAQSLKLRVIGEHVSSFMTLTALRTCGADLAQGNYLGEPRPLAEVDFAKLFP